jgi:hypothetical protein
VLIRITYCRILCVRCAIENAAVLRRDEDV